MKLRRVLKSRSLYFLVRLYVYFACSTFCVSAFSLAAPDLKFEHLLSNDNTRNESIEGFGASTKTIQDSTGFLWFAGESGLARFDSHEYKFFRTDPSTENTLPSNFIQDMAVDKSGQLWVGSTKGLCSYSSTKENFSCFGTAELKDQKPINHFISALAVSPDNRLYIGTKEGLSVLNSERTQFVHYFYEENNVKFVRDIHIDAHDNIWLGTTYSGLIQLDSNLKHVKQWQYDSNNSKSLPSNNINRIASDASGNLWVGSKGEGLARIQLSTGEVRRYAHRLGEIGSPGSNIVEDILVDSKNRVWIAYDHGGLNLYDPATDSFHVYKHNTTRRTSISSNQIRSVYEDKLENLWVGNFSTGIDFYDQSKSLFKTLTHDPKDPTSLSHNGILNIFEDSKNQIWLGTEDGLNLYDRSNGEFKHYKHDDNDPHSLRFNVVVSIKEDQQKNLWIGTWSGGLHKFNPTTQQFKNYYPDPNDPSSFSSPFAWAVDIDKNGDVWVGATEQGGLMRYLPKTDNFITYHHDPQNPDSLVLDHVCGVAGDDNGKIWVATPEGLDLFDPKSEKFKHYQPDPTDPGSISGNVIRVIYKDSKGRIWIGTDGSGVNLYQKEQDSFLTFDKKDGLPSSSVLSITEDKQGNMWFGTSNGLARYEHATGKIKSLHTSDGLAGDNHNRNAILVDSQGVLYVGSTEGLTIFEPKKIDQVDSPNTIYLTDVSVLNTPLHIDRDMPSLETSAPHTEYITLNHKEKFLTIRYALLSFRSAHRNSYAYQLEGFDKSWNYVNDLRSATYTNLDAGDYIFNVKAKDHSGNWSSENTLLSIHIKPAPWRTLWAYAGYICVLCFLIYGYLRYQFRKNDLKNQRNLNAQLIKLDKNKDAFLALTSHELRTPINGMIGLSEAIIDDYGESLSPDINKRLNIIKASGRRLSNLINDILDYSKIIDSKLTLNIGTVDIHAVVEQVNSIVEPLISGKDIRIINNIKPDTYMVKADADRLQQIIINLISNGIKYTDQGFVKVSAALNENSVEILIEDTGIGIPKEHIDQVFNSFHQLQYSGNRIAGGTGLGLSITRQLIELHGSSIHLQSTVGKGSQFRFTLPMANRGDSAQTIKNNVIIPASPTYPQNSKKLLVAMVDDDMVNRMILSGLLNKINCSVDESVSGEALLHKLTVSSFKPDLFILDIILPGMSGFDIYSKLRDNASTHETPVIFLSANSLERENTPIKQLYKCDFLAKPADRNILFEKIVTLTQDNDASNENT
ncbi:MAG: two-component system sensor histidine kinase ChiS [Flavobacteriales bacterium]|jgi:two-component system sensor histidine kinase ChiS